MAIHYEHCLLTLEEAIRYASKETILHIISEQADNRGGEPSPPGFTRYADGRLEPDIYSSAYENAYKSLLNYVLHSSYIVDAWRGKPKGSVMEMIQEGLKTQELQYETLYYVAKGLYKTIVDNKLHINYYFPDIASPESGSGYPDFIATGSSAQDSTLRALDISANRNYETVSIVEAAVYSATH